MLSIVFRGLVEEGLGIAVWQADGSGPEPAAIGHHFVTPIEPITAHYYTASRDYVDPQARGGVVANELVGEWHAVRSVLQQTQFSLGELIVRLPLTTPGEDREGEDWFYRDDVETRYLQLEAPMPLMLKTKTLFQFMPPRLVLTEDYRGVHDFTEVPISLVSDPTLAKLADEALTKDERTLADAFLADIDGRPVRFVVDRIHLSPVTFSGQGRTYACYASIPTARLEVQ